MALIPRTGGGGSGGTTNAYINVSANTAAVTAQFNRLGQTIGNFANRAGRSISNAGQSFGNLDLHLRRINANFVAAGFAVVGLAHKVEDFVQRGARMELFTKRMEGISNSLKEAQQNTDAVIKLAQQVPFKLDTISRGFIKLKAAGIEPIMDDQGNGPLKSMIDAMAAFGGDSEQLDRAIIALSQMAGKGVVSMEELRQQLGESVPTALRIAAREMDMTVAKFVKAVSKGQITWEEFAKVFFEGLDKNYAGAAARLMNTFTGATAQLDTQLDILAKTIFVDTGTMRYFTAAVQMATEKLKELDAFLKTPQGQKYIDDLWEGFKELAVQISKGLEPAKELYEAIKEIGAAVIQVGDSLPAEIVGSGLIGYIFFGRAGVIPGLIVGLLKDDLQDIGKAVATTITDMDNLFNRFGGSLSNAAIGGLIGFRLAGPYGALSGAIIGELAASSSSWEDFVTKVVTGTEVMKRVLTDWDLWANILDPDATSANLDRIAVESVKFTKKFRETIFPPSLPEELKGDMEKVGSSLGGSMENIMQQVQQKADAGREAIIQTVKGISDETAREAAKVSDIKIADFTANFVNKEEAVRQLDDYRQTMEAKVTEIQDRLSALYEQQQQDTNAGIFSPNLEKEIKTYELTLKEAVRLRNDTADQLANIKLMPEGGIAEDTSQLLEEIRNFASGIDTSFESVDRMKEKIREWGQEEDLLREKIEASSLSQESKTELLNALSQAHIELGDSMEAVNEKAAKLNPAFEENGKAVAELNRKINDLDQKGRELSIGKSWTGEAERMGEASNRVQSYLDDIAVAIEDVRVKADKGLISQETANATIARLQAMAASVEGARGRIVNAASDANQAWTEAGRAIYSAIESSLGDAIYNLVTGAKSMKDVLLDLWRSVTRAISNYIAKLIMASLFGGGGAGGGLFGSIFGSNTGSQLSFAGGGMVDGRTGFDNNLVAMRVSRGERITVETAAQQRANKRGGGGDTFIINAVDSYSVQRLLMANGGVMAQSLAHQTRLNRV